MLASTISKIGALGFNSPAARHRAVALCYGLALLAHARAGVDALNATISGMEGITLAGQLTPSYDQVEAGKAYKNTFSLLPDRTGVYYLTVSVSTQIGGVTMGRTFSIPLVVGDLQSQQKAVANPAKDASGQAIESMKAAESKQ